MLARIYSCAVVGLDGVIVEVEVDYTSGLPGMTIVGLPDTAVQESRERVQTAVRNAGLEFPRRRVVVNLAPASVRKQWPPFDRALPAHRGATCAHVHPDRLRRNQGAGTCQARPGGGRCRKS